MAFRTEAEEKNIEVNSKVKTSIADLKEDFGQKVNIIENKLVDDMFENDNEFIAEDNHQSSISRFRKSHFGTKEQITSKLQHTEISLF